MQSVFLRFPNGRSKAVTFSYDDGVPQDKRLAEMFTAYGIKATFNFNSKGSRPTAFSDEEIQEIFLSKGHEIAGHGAYHRANGNVRAIEGIRDVLDGRLELEKRCGTIIRGMAYPDTGINQLSSNINYEKIKSYLIELDIAYARTDGGKNEKFRLPEDFYAWVPTAHHDDPQIMEYIDKFLKTKTSQASYHAQRSSRLLFIWGHSFEFDRNDNWEHIESICKALSGNNDLWFATNIEIHDYIEAYNRLIYSADGSKVYNPTLHTIWLEFCSELFTVRPGETVIIPENAPKPIW